MQYILMQLALKRFYKLVQFFLLIFVFSKLAKKCLDIGMLYMRKRFQ